MSDDEVQTLAAEDDPLMVAWKAYQQTAEFANSKKLAAHEQHLMGSLWAVFESGFRAGDSDATDRASRIVQLAREDRIDRDWRSVIYRIESGNETVHSEDDDAKANGEAR